MAKQDELQEIAVKKCLDFYKGGTSGYLDVAMRFGKTKTSLDFINKKFKKEPYVLIAYPDNKIKQSWLDEIDKIGFTKNKNFVYVNFSSLKNYLYHDWDLFIIDEFPSCSFNELEYCRIIINKSKFTLGLSGTVSEETKKSWSFIKEIYKYDTLQGIEDGILADYQISVHLVDLDNVIKTKNKQGKELTEKKRFDNYTFVIEKLKKEGKSFMQLALARNRLSLSSLGKFNYTKKLIQSLNKRTIVFTGLTNVADKFGYSYHSKSKSTEWYDKFQNKEIDLLALGAMGKMGVSFTDLESVVLMSYSYNQEESSQILNRAIKLDYKGKIADLHIICLNEPNEKKKVKETLSMLDNKKIKYV